MKRIVGLLCAFMFSTMSLSSFAQEYYKWSNGKKTNLVQVEQTWVIVSQFKGPKVRGHQLPVGLAAKTTTYETPYGTTDFVSNVTLGQVKELEKLNPSADIVPVFYAVDGVQYPLRKIRVHWRENEDTNRRKGIEQEFGLVPLRETKIGHLVEIIYKLASNRGTSSIDIANRIYERGGIPFSQPEIIYV